VEANADHERDAAEQAASVARTKGSKYTGEQPTSVDKLKNQSSQITDEAVEEGKRDVENAKTTGAGYVQQVKEMASNAAATAQERLPSAITEKTSETSASQPQDRGTTGKTTGAGYVQQAKEMASNAAATAQERLPSAITGKTSETSASQPQDRSTSSTTSTTGGLTTMIQDTATTAANTASSYLASAKEVAQPHIDRAVAAAQNMLGSAGTQGAQLKDMPASPAAPAAEGIPTTSAPLESGPHKVDTPYPTTTTKVGTKDIAQTSAEKNVN